ncbi:hypothetical protein [Amycolatopsis sp. NPDC059657]|uniref:hypothetical protein n=1 Tax=Amycolatopsis sp. NPDC059657 TaxID=3346899 RepID=UPI0036728BEA
MAKPSTPHVNILASWFLDDLAVFTRLVFLAVIAMFCTACGSSSSVPDMSLENRWSPTISAVLSAKGGCEVWVGIECGNWLLAMNGTATDLGKAIDARGDSAHFSEAKQLIAKVHEDFDKWTTALCSTHLSSEGSVMTDQNTCVRWSQGGYEAMVKLQEALRPAR